MGYELKRDYQSILIKFNIQPTPARVLLLKMICEQFEQGFTLFDLLNTSEALDYSMGSSTIVFTIGLFKMRGLVKRVEDKVHNPNRKAGRPEATFICTLTPLKGETDN